MGGGSKSSTNGSKAGVEAGAGGGGFRSRMEYYLHSGDKKHVFAGIAIITAVFGVPWLWKKEKKEPTIVEVGLWQAIST
ncbi:hypothetical protein RJ641_024391 [Dillenia turbinata]|uniref:Uncharacterized protein n=1 Tax=Dillenia turbinata TaxID=194707 RepID=A0AAN8UKG3_9MAGN